MTRGGIPFGDNQIQDVRLGMVSDQKSKRPLELRRQGWVSKCTFYMALPRKSRKRSPGGHVSPDGQYLHSSSIHSNLHNLQNNSICWLSSLRIVREEVSGSGLKSIQ